MGRKETRGVAAAVEGTSTVKHVVVNGESREAAAATLALLLEELGYGDQKVATALNGDFVPERLRGATVIAPGDAIEIVSPRQGG